MYEVVGGVLGPNPKIPANVSPLVLKSLKVSILKKGYLSTQYCLFPRQT